MTGSIVSRLRVAGVADDGGGVFRAAGAAGAGVATNATAAAESSRGVDLRDLLAEVLCGHRWCIHHLDDGLDHRSVLERSRLLLCCAVWCTRF